MPEQLAFSFSIRVLDHLGAAETAYDCNSKAPNTNKSITGRLKGSRANGQRILSREPILNNTERFFGSVRGGSVPVEVFRNESSSPEQSAEDRKWLSNFMESRWDQVRRPD